MNAEHLFRPRGWFKLWWAPASQSFWYQPQNFRNWADTNQEVLPRLQRSFFQCPQRSSFRRLL